MFKIFHRDVFYRHGTIELYISHIVHSFAFEKILMRNRAGHGSGIVTTYHSRYIIKDPFVLGKPIRHCIVIARFHADQSIFIANLL